MNRWATFSRRLRRLFLRKPALDENNASQPDFAVFLNVFAFLHVVLSSSQVVLSSSHVVLASLPVVLAPPPVVLAPPRFVLAFLPVVSPSMEVAVAFRRVVEAPLDVVLPSRCVDLEDLPGVVDLTLTAHYSGNQVYSAEPRFLLNTANWEAPRRNVRLPNPPVGVTYPCRRDPNQ